MKSGRAKGKKRKVREPSSEDSSDSGNETPIVSVAASRTRRRGVQKTLDKTESDDTLASLAAAASSLFSLSTARLSSSQDSGEVFSSQLSGGHEQNEGNDADRPASPALKRRRQVSSGTADDPEKPPLPRRRGGATRGTRGGGGAAAATSAAVAGSSAADDEEYVSGGGGGGDGGGRGGARPPTRASSAFFLPTAPAAAVPDDLFGPQYATHIRPLINALSSRLRRWAVFEWFYPTLDREYFAVNEFQQCLDQRQLGGVTHLTRSEWAMLRATLGRPRRLSGVFLAQERQKLEQCRQRMRKAQAPGAPPPSSFPCAVPPQLQVGDMVTALHPTKRLPCRGQILTTDSERRRYRVQFDRMEMGAPMLEESEIAMHGPPALLHPAHASYGGEDEAFFYPNAAVWGAAPQEQGEAWYEAAAFEGRLALESLGGAPAAAAAAAAAAAGLLPMDVHSGLANGSLPVGWAQEGAEPFMLAAAADAGANRAAAGPTERMRESQFPWLEKLGFPELAPALRGFDGAVSPLPDPTAVPAALAPPASKKQREQSHQLPRSILELLKRKESLLRVLKEMNKVVETQHVDYGSKGASYDRNGKAAAKLESAEEAVQGEDRGYVACNGSRASSSSHTTVGLAFEHQYTWVVSSLEATNRALDPAISEVRRLTGGDGNAAAVSPVEGASNNNGNGSSSGGGSAQDGASSSRSKGGASAEGGSADLASLSETDLPAVLKLLQDSYERAEALVGGEEELPPLLPLGTAHYEDAGSSGDSAAGAGMAGKTEGNGGSDDGGGEGGGGSFGGEESETSVVEACMGLLSVVQSCAEGELPAAEASQALQLALVWARPRCPDGTALFGEVEASMELLKGELAAS